MAKRKRGGKKAGGGGSSGGGNDDSDDKKTRTSGSGGGESSSSSDSSGSGGSDLPTRKVPADPDPTPSSGTSTPSKPAGGDKKDSDQPPVESDPKPPNGESSPSKPTPPSSGSGKDTQEPKAPQQPSNDAPKPSEPKPPAETEPKAPSGSSPSTPSDGAGAGSSPSEPKPPVDTGPPVGGPAAKEPKNEKTPFASETSSNSRTTNGRERGAQGASAASESSANQTGGPPVVDVGEEFTVGATEDPTGDISINQAPDAPDPQVGAFYDEETAEQVQQAAERADNAAAESLNEQTGTDRFDESDITVETQRDESGGLIVGATLSESGQETAVSIAEEDAFEQVQQSTDADLSRDDVVIDVSGSSVEAELTESGLRQEAAAQNDRFSADDYIAGNGEVFLSNEAEREFVAAQTPGLEADEVVLQDTREEEPTSYGEVNRAINADGPTGGVTTEVEVTDEGAASIRAAQRDSERDFLSGTVDTVEAGLSEVAQVGSGDEDTTVEFRGDGSVINDLSQSDADADIPASGEIFDGGNVVGGEEAESRLRDLSEDFEERVVDPTSSAVGDLAAERTGVPTPASPTGVLNAGANVVSGVEALARGQPEEAPTTPAERAERREGLAEGATESAVGLANPGQLGLIGIEGAEVAVDFAGASPAVESGGGSENFGEFGQRLGAAGARAATGTAAAAEADPNQFAGQLVGGAVIGSAAETTFRRALRGTPSSRTPDSVSSPDAAADAGTAGLIGGRGPNIEVEAGPNVASGVVDVNVNADLRRALDERAQQMRQAPSDAAESVRSASDRVATSVSEGADSAMNTVRNTEVSADAAVQSGRARAADLSESVRDAPSTINQQVADLSESVRDAPSTVNQQASDLVERGQQAAQNAEVSAAANVADARERASAGVNRARLAGRRVKRDVGDVNFPTAVVTEDSGSLDFSPERLGQRVADGARERVDRARLAGRRASRDVGNLNVPTAIVTEDSGSFDLSPEALGQRVADSARERANRARLAGRRARRDVGDLNVPTAVVTDDSDSFDLFPERLGQRVADSARERVGRARDFGVRVDVGRPTSRTVDASELEIDGQPGVEFRGDFDSDDANPAFEPGDSGASPELFETDADNTGNGQIALRQTDSRRGSGQRAETGTRRDRVDATGRTSAVGAGVGAGLNTVTRPEVRADQGVTVDQTTGVGTQLDQRDATTPITTQVPDNRFDVATGVEADARTDPFSELRTEARTETRVNQRVGFESTSRVNAGFEQRQATEVDQRRRDRRRRVDADFPADPRDDDSQQRRRRGFDQVEFNNAVAGVGDVLGFSSSGSGGLDDDIDASGGLF